MSTIHNAHSTLTSAVTVAGRPWPLIAKAAHIPDDATAVVFIIDSNAESVDGLRQTLQAHDYEVLVFGDIQTFLTAHQSGRRGCLLVDVTTPGAGGIELITALKSHDSCLPVIAIATQFAAARVVAAMKAGACDCLHMPCTDGLLVSTIERVLDEAGVEFDPIAYRALAIQRVATLTPRQREVLNLITLGHPSKNIAADLQISQRTVENHRAAIAKRTCSKSLSDVVHTAICANCSLMKAVH